MADVGWVDPAGQLVAEAWPESADLDPEMLGLYLTASYEQCLDFLPHNDDDEPIVPDPVPARFKLAQIAQAKSVQQAGVLNPSGTVEQTGYTIFPMDWHVRNLLRPRRIVGVL